MLSPESMDALQYAMRDKLDFSEDHLYRPAEGDVVCTVDIAHKNDSATIGIDFTKLPNEPLQSLSISVALDPIVNEYMPGYFAFYEGPLIVRTLQQLAGSIPDFKVVIVDGHGLAHPRKFGLACYVGLELDKPAIGVAKTPLLEYDRAALPAPQYAQETFQVDGELVGVALRLQAGINPVFISAGNKIDLDTSIVVIKQLTSDFRLPDNSRRAHQASISEATTLLPFKTS